MQRAMLLVRGFLDGRTPLLPSHLCHWFVVESRACHFPSPGLTRKLPISLPNVPRETWPQNARTRLYKHNKERSLGSWHLLATPAAQRPEPVSRGASKIPIDFCRAAAGFRSRATFFRTTLLLCALRISVRFGRSRSDCRVIGCLL